MSRHYKPPVPERSPGFEDRLRALPELPGVYLMRDRGGVIIYVGKALSLRNRVRSYFGSLKGEVPKTWRLVSNIYDFEYIITDTELEALILENQLIKKHKPQYNIRLKDDKSYPFIKVTVQDEWPRVVPARQRLNDGAKYFGPYSGMGTVQATIALLDKLFPFRTCDKEITGNDSRPCVEYFIHRCLGPCAGLADAKAYKEAIANVTMFLEGRQGTVIKSIQREMRRASDNLEYERAAVFRDRIRVLERLRADQKVFNTTGGDQDIIALAQRDGDACAQVFFIRGGRLLGRENYPLEDNLESDPAEIMRSFIQQFYSESSSVPPNLVLQHEVSDAEVIQSWLRERRGSKVVLAVPRRGRNKDLLEMAAKNAAESLEQMKLRWLSDEQKAVAALTELQSVLGLTVWPQRIECYDVAHLQGTDTAGAMVVFEQGTPQRKEYRRFQIRTSANNDYMSMKEMLTRRFRRAAAEQSEAARDYSLRAARNGTRDEPAPGDSREAIARLREEELESQGEASIGDSVEEMLEKAHRASDRSNIASSDSTNWSSWAVLPDLVVIDGGKGQLSAAQEVMAELDLLDVPMIALAKREEEIFLPGRTEPTVLSPRSEALRLLQRIRDEAHRFSNTYNRKLGAKRATRSKLDTIPGIGPKRKKALMKQFGTVKAMREATLEQVLAVPGMDRTSAQRLKENLT